MGFDKLSMSGCCLLLAQPKRPAQPEPVEGRANSVELETTPRAPSVHPPSASPRAAGWSNPASRTAPRRARTINAGQDETGTAGHA